MEGTAYSPSSPAGWPLPRTRCWPPRRDPVGREDAGGGRRRRRRAGAAALAPGRHAGRRAGRGRGPQDRQEAARVVLDRGLVHPPRRHPPAHRTRHRAPRQAPRGRPVPDPRRTARRAGLPRAGRRHLRRDRGAPHQPHVRELAEKQLLDEAGRLHATDLTKAARHLIHVVDPDGAERKAERDLERQDRAAHLGRYLAITEDGAGGVRLKGRGTVEDAARIKAALLPLTKPAPAVGRGRGLRRGRRTSATTAPGCGTRWCRPASTR